MGAIEPHGTDSVPRTSYLNKESIARAEGLSKAAISEVLPPTRWTPHNAGLMLDAEA